MNVRRGAVSALISGRQIAHSSSLPMNVIVTGASAGIGRATAVALVQNGANVVAVARRAGRLDALARDLRREPGRLLPIAGDIRQPPFARQLAAATVGAFGRIDVLVNNAGIGHRSALADMPAEDVATLLDTNVVALVQLTQAVIPHMRRQGSGHIINVSSIVGERPLPNSALYCASKASVNMLSRSLRMELRPDHIRVTVVYPGLTETEFGTARLGEQGTNRFGLNGVPAERVAHRIVAAIHHGRDEVYISPFDWLFVQLNRHFPRLTDWLVARVAHFA